MKNTTLLIIFGLIVFAVAGYFIFANSVSAGKNSSNNADVQKITLSLKNGNYYPNTLSVKANQEVEITLDSSVRGCYRTFVIRDFGISQTLRNPTDTIKFTPTQTGSFRFACGMGMGFGTIIVE
jgi:Cu+-exporting ATPase